MQNTVEGEKPLIKRKEILETKISRATAFLENSQTPGWIDKKHPRVVNLSLSGQNQKDFSRKDYFRNAIRIGNINLRLRDITLPVFYEELDEIETRLDSETEPFSSAEKTLLGNMMLNHNNTYIKFNHHDFIFEIDKDLLPSCQSLRNEPWGFRNQELMLQAREKLIDKLGRILNADNAGELINFQDGETKLVLEWLNKQNQEQFVGLMPYFLASTPTQASIIDGRLVKFMLEWTPSSEIVSLAKQRIEDTVDNQPGVDKPVLRATEQLNTADFILDPEEVFVFINGILAEFIKNKPNLTRNGEAVKVVLDIVSSVKPENSNCDEKTKHDYLALRAKALNKLRGIITASELQQGQIISLQTDVKVERFLRVLCLQDSSHGDRAKFLLDVLEELRNRSASSIRGQETMTFNKWAKGDTVQEPTDEPTANAPIIPEKPSQPTDETELEKGESSEKEMMELIAEYINLALNSNLSFPASIDQIKTKFTRLTTRYIRWAYADNNYVNPVDEKDNHHPLFGITDIVLMRVLLEKRRSGGVQPKELERIKGIIKNEELRIRQERLEGNKPTSGDQRLQTFQLEEDLRTYRTIKAEYDDSRQHGLPVPEEDEIANNQEISRIMTELKKLKAQ